MSSQHLWPAGGIIARLLSPLVLAMVTRLVTRVRHSRLVGPVLNHFFPEEEGPHPDQRDEVPQVSINADSIDRLRAALRDTVQEGREADGSHLDRLITELRQQNDSLQQLVLAVEGMREEARARHANTYTVTSTITQAN